MEKLLQQTAYMSVSVCHFWTYTTFYRTHTVLFSASMDETLCAVQVLYFRSRTWIIEIVANNEYGNPFLLT